MLSQPKIVKLHQKQKEIIQSPARFKIIRAGRRGGKTALAIEKMVFEAVSGKDRNIFYVAPTQVQARDIIWEQLKRRLHGVGKFHQDFLEARVPTKDGGQSLIKLAGWEKRENFRGKSAHLIVFDELDTMKDFFVGWNKIFRYTLLDTAGDAWFIGTPNKETPNLKRLESLTDPDYQAFHFTSFDNPYLPDSEKVKMIEEGKANPEAYRQEALAEYITNEGSLFKYDALIDVFSNTIDKSSDKYLIVDIADDGTDKTIFSFWQGLEEYKRVGYQRLNTEGIISQIKEDARDEKIPYSHIAVDAIGVGAGVASNSQLDGIIGFKSSFSPLKTERNITNPASVFMSDYKNLRSQCVCTLADLVNNHKIASKLTDVDKEVIIAELSQYQIVSSEDGKRQVTAKEDVKQNLGRSPDASDTWIMRMFFHLKGRGEERGEIVTTQINQFNRNRLANRSNK